MARARGVSVRRLRSRDLPFDDVVYAASTCLPMVSMRLAQVRSFRAGLPVPRTATNVERSHLIMSATGFDVATAAAAEELLLLAYRTFSVANDLQNRADELLRLDPCEFGELAERIKQVAEVTRRDTAALIARAQQMRAAASKVRSSDWE